MKLNSNFPSNLLVKSFFCGLALLSGIAAFAAEDWKGPTDTYDNEFGAMTGLGIVDGTPTYALLGTAARRIVPKGFIPDINNSVWIEGEAGPFFVYGTGFFSYSAHLRWDFRKDEEWTLYALAGVAGHVTPDALGSKFELFPRVALGGILNIAAPCALRFELSHEWVTFGVLFPI
jgi:hypothetical protein